MDARNEHLLINYLDRTLEEREMREIETLINTDREIREQYQFLQLAVQAVEYSALFEHVAAVKEQYKAIHPSQVLAPEQRRGKLVTLRNVYRVAACLLFLVIATGTFKYINTSSSNIYKQTFVPYSLNTSRGTERISEMEQAYRNKNWSEVVAAFNKSTEKDNKGFFLAGMANMQMQQYATAGNLFEQVLQHNAQTGDDYFHDDAQFYLAMSYLAGNKTKEALSIIQQIKASKTHLYYERVAHISSTEMLILDFKSGK
jgi:tetratricopeptide (TPR) repeat protein